MTVVLLSLTPWEGTPRILANECKHLELWKFADLSLWGLPVLCYDAVDFHSFLWCFGNPISIPHIQKPVAGRWLKTLFTMFFVITGSNEHGRLLQAGKCGRMNWKWMSCLICWHLFQHLSLHLSPSHWCMYEGGVDAGEGSGAEQGRSFYQPLLFLFLFFFSHAVTWAMPGTIRLAPNTVPDDAGENSLVCFKQTLIAWAWALQS